MVYAARIRRQAHPCAHEAAIATRSPAEDSVVTEARAEGAPLIVIRIGSAAGVRTFRQRAPRVAAPAGAAALSAPYTQNTELPDAVRRHLPPHAQHIFREAFNHAWQQYGDDPRREEIAFRVGWAAVKKKYRKAGDARLPR